jgi:hypothetical protein
LVPEATARESRHDLERGLVSALTSVDFMDRLDDRRMFVRELADAIGEGFSVAENPSARLHVIALVQACLRYRDGLRWLIQKLELYAPGQSGTIAAAGLTQSFQVLDVVPPAEREAVHDLLRQAEPVSPADLEALWYMATDDLSPLPEGRIRSARAAFDHLAGLNARPDGLPRAIAFVEYLAARLTGDLAARVRQWTDAEAAALGLTAELDALRQAARGTPLPFVSEPCIVFLLEEHPLLSQWYLLSHWVQHRPGHWQPRRGPDHEVTLADAAQVVDEVLGQAEEAWGTHAGRVRVEFVLPLSLLNEPVEWWQSNLGSPGAMPLCLDYPVFVRSLDRMRKPRLHRFWRNRWEALAAAHLMKIHWILDGDADREAWNRELHADESITAVALGRPPLPSLQGAEEQLWMALHAGVPVIIWDRRDRRPQDFPNLIATLAGGLPMILGDRIKDLRIQAALSGDAGIDGHAGHHITILWDDPGRLIDVSSYPQTPGQALRKASGLD